MENCSSDSYENKFLYIRRKIKKKNHFNFHVCYCPHQHNCSGLRFGSSETQYIIENSGYNYEIQPDQEVNFGFCVTGEGLEIPKAFEICSQRTDKAENEYIVSLNVTNDWGNGFTGEIKIQNLSAEPIPRLLACLILSIYLKLTFRQLSKTFQILIPIQILSRYRLK